MPVFAGGGQQPSDANPRSSQPPGLPLRNRILSPWFTAHVHTPLCTELPSRCHETSQGIHFPGD